MLVPESCTLLKVKVVGDIAEAPDDVAALAIDLVQRRRTPGGNQVGAIIVLLHSAVRRGSDLTPLWRKDTGTNELMWQ